jgi:hypothetical protein
MYRPNFIVTAPISYATIISYDFVVKPVEAPPGFPVQGASIWGQALWGQAKWYGGTSPQRGWYMAQGLGVSVSVAIGLRSNSETLWVSTDFSYIIGGIL